MSKTTTQTSDFTVTFRGVRGNYPTPERDKLEYGGNTTCVEVRVGKRLLILDAGTGIISLGSALMEDILANGGLSATLLFTHTHQDHVQGFPFFKPAYLPSSELFIFGPGSVVADLEECLSRAMLPSNFPVELQEMISTQYIRTVDEASVICYPTVKSPPEVREAHTAGKAKASELRIHMMRNLSNPRTTVFTYRIEWKGRSIVFATDVEGYRGGDARLTEFAHGTNLLIHDAHFDVRDYTDPARPRQGWGHSTWEMAAEVAKRAKVKQLALCHYAPTYDDTQVAAMEAATKKLFPRTIAGREGLTLSI